MANAFADIGYNTGPAEEAAPKESNAFADLGFEGVPAQSPQEVPDKSDVAGDLLGLNDSRTPTQIMEEYETKLGPSEGHKSPAEIAQGAVADSITWASDRIVDMAFTIGDAVIPDAWQEAVVDTSEKAWTALMQNDWAREGIEMAKLGMEAYEEWAKENPDYANRLEEVVTIGSVVRPKGFVKPKDRPRLEKIVEQRALKTRGDKVRKMMEPPGKKGEGTLIINKQGVKEYKPSQFEADVNKEVVKVPGVDPKKPYTHNMNAVREQSTKYKDELDKLAAKAGTMDVNTLRGELNDLTESLSERTLLVGDPAKIGQSIYKKADELLAAGDGSVSSVLQARRDLDAWVRSQKNVFDSSFENATSVALKEIRDHMNNAVDKAIGNGKATDLLQKQNKLLFAGDRLEAHALKEADGSIGRLIQRMEKATGEKFPTTPLAQWATGAYALGKWTLWAPLLPVVGGWKGVKWLGTPEGKLALGKAADAFKDNAAVMAELQPLIQAAEGLGPPEEEDY